MAGHGSDRVASPSHLPLRSRFLSDRSAIEALDDVWRALLASATHPSVFLGPDFARAWRETLGAQARLLVVCVEEPDGTPRLLAPLAATPGSVVWHQMAERRADYGGPIHAAGDRDAVQGLLQAIRDLPSGDRVRFRNVLAGSDLAAAIPHAVAPNAPLPARLSSLARPRTPVAARFTRAVHHTVDRRGIEEQAERLDSKDVRYQIRWLERSGPLRYERWTDPAAIEPALDDLFALHRRSFERGDRTSQFADATERDFYRALVEHVGGRGEVRLDRLTVDDRLVATHLGFEHDGRALWYKPCYEPDLAKGSPGNVLLCHVLRDARDRGLVEVDYLSGDEAYKARFGGVPRATDEIDLYPTRVAWRRSRWDRT